MLAKSRNAVFFQWFVCRVSPKVGLLKRRARSRVVRGEVKNCTPLWRKAHSEVKMYKTWRVRSTSCRSDVEKLYAPVAKSTFGSENAQNTTCLDHFCCADVEKMHAAVAKSIFGSENAQNMTGLDHFCTCWCWKNARGCGEKHIWKWKCTKHDGFGPLLYVLMLKKCTRLWRKAHLEVKMLKTVVFGALFDVLMSKN